MLLSPLRGINSDNTMIISVKNDITIFLNLPEHK